MTKLSPVPIPLKHWLEGDLLLLGKASVWTDLLTTLVQTSVGARRDPSLLRVAVLPTVVLGLILLWLWQGVLLWALLLGGGSALLIYQSLTLKTSPWHRVRQWLRHPNAPLWLSVGGGLGLCMMSYGALAVWQHLHSPGLAMVLLLQEMGIMAVLALAVHLLLTQPQPSLQSFERCVAGLLHRDELRRLIAVRQLGTLITQDRLSATERSQSLDYLKLLAQREQSLLVQHAIQDGLASLRSVPPALPAGCYASSSMTVLRSRSRS